MDPLSVLAGAAVVACAIAVAAAGRALGRRARDARAGALVAVDVDGRGPLLRSARYGLVGRPDELRRRRDGRIVPVEFKSRPAPPGGPPPSHRAQLGAYCLLVEEATGVPPPFGILRYGDGREFRVAWDGAARAELVRLRAEMARRYDGRATPARGKCAGCRWNRVCDVRAA